MPLQPQDSPATRGELAIMLMIFAATLGALLAVAVVGGGVASWPAVALFALLLRLDAAVQFSRSEHAVHSSEEAFLVVAILVLAPMDLAALLLLTGAMAALFDSTSIVGMVARFCNVVPAAIGASALYAVTGGASVDEVSTVVVGALVATAGMRVGEALLFLGLAVRDGLAAWWSFVRTDVADRERALEAATHLAMSLPIALAWPRGSWIVVCAIVPLVVTARSAWNAHRLQEAERRIGVDPLTGLANRDRLLAHVGAELRAAERYGHPLALLMGDLDNFKRVNDHHGHLSGDEVLRRTSRALHDMMDGDQRCFAARYGGEEFAIVVSTYDRARVLELAERIRSRVHDDLTDEFGTSISLGVAYAEPQDRFESIVDRADKALYSAKLAGKDRVHEWQVGHATARPAASLIDAA